MTEPCCAPLGDDARACPECGRGGRAVDRITLAAMLRPAALARLEPGGYRFCATPGCPVVYFDRTARFRIDDVAVPVFQKQPPGARLVCYCFDVTEGDVDREIAVGGRSTAVERISALVKAGRCACEVKNPQGSCCLGNLGAVVRSAGIESGAAATGAPT